MAGASSNSDSEFAAGPSPFIRLKPPFIMNRLLATTRTLLPLHSQSVLRNVVRLKTVKITFFEESNNNMVEVQGELGKTVLDVAIANNVDIEGACGGELACSTCHVIVPRDIYDKLPAKKEEEEDMLDLAMGLTPT